MSAPYVDPVRALAATTYKYEALDNDFCRHWMAGPLPYDQVEVFAREFYARTVDPSVMVALSVLHTEDLTARVECVKDLYSEYGGEAEKEHKEQAVISAAQVCETDTDFRRVQEGFDSFLDLTADYWKGVHGAMLAA
jgi:hypothetical protein